MKKGSTGSLIPLAGLSSNNLEQTDEVERTSIGLRNVAVKSTVPQVKITIVLVAVNFEGSNVLNHPGTKQL